MKISVILSCLNEEFWMHIALNSLNDQTIPFELIVVDNESEDRTVEIAKTYTPLVFTAPRGKLNAKQLGVLEASGDVIVTADADCLYPSNFLELITRHFIDPDVTFVCGVVHAMQIGEVQKALERVIKGTVFALLRYAPSPVTAFRTDAFFKAGGYNLAVNQFNFLSMVMEEEISFPQRLAKQGRVVYEPQATAYHIDRRGLCTIFQTDLEHPPNHKALYQYCKQIFTGERF